VVPLVDGDSLLELTGGPLKPLVVADQAHALTAVKADGGSVALNVVPQEVVFTCTGATYNFLKKSRTNQWV
jgi:hypothetical protein